MLRTVSAEAIRTPRDLAALIDHTLLSPGATPDDLSRVCREAREHRFAAVCVHGHAVAEAARLLAGSGVPVASVVDFPRGEGATDARVAEAVAAVRAGAAELDLVVALPALAAGRFEHVLDDLRAVVRAAAAPVKVILETARLGRDQIVAGAAIARAAGAAYVKTSTGFGGGGATIADVTLLRSVVGDALGVKASGGVRTADEARAMVRAGASRIGTSHAVAIVQGAFRD